MVCAKLTSSVTLLVIFLSFTVKNVYSVKCYVCDNCVNVDTNTTTQDNCGACIKGGVPKVFMQRQCVDKCSDIASKFPIKDVLDCCTTELCNDATKLKPLVSVTIAVCLIWRMLTGPRLD
uniref:UPAR/Ly6 domain-containing protein n=1 Tax=Trichobilharzia regenti TaxID=157069 RepID=A0AA85JX34_TRIRE|nr:unnamed protein product [Trichobilharzia regenti]